MLSVIVDANQLIKSYFLDSNVFPLLRLYFSRHPDSDLIVPQIVFDEVVHNFENDIESDKKFYVKLVSYLTEGKCSDIKSIVQWYEGYLREKLTDLGAGIIPYPNVEHKDIIERYLQNKRPFKDRKGDVAGYKDSLIWETILQMMRGHKKTAESHFVFISGDGDFTARSEDKTILHPELEAEIRSLGPASFRVIPDLASFAEEYIEKGSKVREEKFIEFIKEEDVLNNLLDPGSWDSMKSGINIGRVLPEVFRDPSIYEARVEHATVSSEYELDEKSWLIVGHINAGVDLDALIDDYEYDMYDKQFDMSIQSREHAQNLYRVSMYLNVNVTVSVFYDVETDKFSKDSIEVGDIKLVKSR